MRSGAHEQDEARQVNKFPGRNGLGGTEKRNGPGAASGRIFTMAWLRTARSGATTDEENKRGKSDL